MTPGALIEDAAQPDRSHAFPGGVAEARAALIKLAEGTTDGSEEECYKIARTFALDGTTVGMSELFTVMEAREIKPSVRIYAEAMMDANKTGRYQYALDKFEEIMRQGLEPSMDVWAEIVFAHVRLGNYQQASKVTQALSKSGVTWDVRIYNALMEAAIAQRNTAQGEQLFIQMKQVIFCFIV